MTKIKRIIGKICTSIIYAGTALLVLCLFVVLVDEFGILVAIICMAGGGLLLFSMWAGVNWGNL